MNRSIIAILVLLAPGPPAMAQDQWQRRLGREQAVAAYGVVARSLVEQYEDGARALFACTRPVGHRLCEFHNSGQLGSLPRPQEILRAIGQTGDVVAWFVFQHYTELQDIDRCDAFIVSPLDYALNLRQLEAGAAEIRSRRIQQAKAESPAEMNLRAIAAGGGILVLVALVVWWWRRGYQSGPPGAV